ncbi:MAG: TIGR02270 family protein [Deltaproteobacteria bacterium]|nr:TIGR02270 family protein [Deltaproteobacteria bacterium]
MVIQGIITEFTEEAAFLWHLRNRAVGAPHFSLYDLVKLDERIEAHLDGLRVSGEAGWDVCEATLGGEYSEKYFAPSVLAFEGGNRTRIEKVLDAIGQDTGKARAVISALGWISYEQAEPHIKNLVSSESPFHRYIGIAACAVHRRDPGQYLDKSVLDTSTLLIARGLRTYGELGKDIKLCHSAIRDNLSDNDDGIRFSTAWSGTLSDNAEAVDVLKSFVVPDSPYREKALNTALRRMELPAALSFQNHLAQSPGTIRLSAKGAGIIGDPVLVPWLFDQMKTPALARVAGEAFTMITGADIDQEELRGKRPEAFNAGPNDDPDDDNVEMDADENLSWPDVELIGKWWDMNEGKLRSGTRYLLGKTISGQHLRHVLETGRQRQRAAAALELAMLEPGRPLFEVKAPGGRQREELRVKGDL